MAENGQCSDRFLHAIQQVIVAHTEELSSHRVTYLDSQCDETNGLGHISFAKFHGYAPGFVVSCVDDSVGTKSSARNQFSENFDDFVPLERLSESCRTDLSDLDLHFDHTPSNSVHSQDLELVMPEKNSFYSMYNQVRTERVAICWGRFVHQVLEGAKLESYRLRQLWADVVKDPWNSLYRPATNSGANAMIHVLSQQPAARGRIPRPSLFSAATTAVSFFAAVSSFSRIRALRSSIVMHPNSLQRTVWLLSALIVVLYDAIMVPMQVFDIEENHTLSVLLLITQVFWTLDLILSFFTGVYDDGKVEMRLEKVVKLYVRTWFTVDALILLPTWLEIILDQSDMSDGSRWRLVKLLKWFRFLRLVRLTKCQKALKFASITVYTPTTLLAFGVVQNMAALLFFNHTTACLFFAIGKRGWVAQYVPNRTATYQYLTALHWCFTNYQGNSEIHVGTDSSWEERLFAAASVWLAVLALTCFGARLTDVMLQFRALAKERNERQSLMLEFLANHSIRADVGVRVKYFLQWKITEESDSRVHEVFKFLPTSLLMDLMFEARTPVLRAQHCLFIFLVREHPQVVRNFCTNAISVISLAPGEFVFQQHEPSLHMYFVEKGLMTYSMWRHMSTDENKYRKKKSEDSIYPKDTLSEACLWVAKWLHRGDLMAVKTPVVLALGAKEFERSFREYWTAVHTILPYVRLFVTVMYREAPDISDLYYDLREQDDEGTDMLGWISPRPSLDSKAGRYFPRLWRGSSSTLGMSSRGSGHQSSPWASPCRSETTHIRVVSPTSPRPPVSPTSPRPPVRSASRDSY